MEATPKKKLSVSRKLLLSLGILGAAGAVAGLGTYAQFTDSTSANQSVSTGTVDINLASAGSSNRLNVPATLVAAGDTIERTADINIAGTLDLAGITLTSSAATSSALDTDATDGLQLQIDWCSQAWTEGGTAPAYTYTCGGTTKSALATGPVIRTSATLNNLALTGGGTEHLRLKWTLPSSAVQPTHSGKTSDITYNFVGVQRAATSR